jgi:N-acetylglutamate synthase-like GNAT family acetyltransferase
MYKTITPVTDSDFENYYKCRWELLRKPWNQPVGSERDEIEDSSIHRMVVSNNNAIAVGRLHYIASTTAQIRYLAVKKTYQRQGVGKAIYSCLEEEARNNQVKLIILHARENAVSFYEKLGFTVVKKTYLLFNEIQHYEMHKHL